MCICTHSGNYIVVYTHYLTTYEVKHYNVPILIEMLGVTILCDNFVFIL